MRFPAFDFFLNTILPSKPSVVPVNERPAMCPRTRAHPSSWTGTSPIPPAAAASPTPPAAAVNPISIANPTSVAPTLIANPIPEPCVQTDDNAELQMTVVPGT